MGKAGVVFGNLGEVGANPFKSTTGASQELREEIPVYPQNSFPLHGKTGFDLPHSSQKIPILELEIPSRRCRSPEQRLGNVGSCRDGKREFLSRAPDTDPEEEVLSEPGNFPNRV